MMRVYSCLFFLLIAPLYGAELTQIASIQAENRQLPNVVPGDILIVRKSPGNGTELFLKDQSIGNLKDFLSVSVVARAFDGTLYIQGGSVNHPGRIVIVEGGQVSSPITYGLDSVFNIQVTQDGVLSVMGNDRNGQRRIVLVKGGRVYEQQNHIFPMIHSMYVGLDGTMYVLGNDKQEKRSIAMITNGQMKDLQGYDFSMIHSIKLATNGTLYILGDGGQIVSVKDKVVSTPTTYGLSSVEFIHLERDNALYIAGSDHNDQFCVRIIKEGQVPVNFELPSMYTVKSMQVSLDGTLYILGTNGNEKDGIVSIKDNLVSALDDYGMSSINTISIDREGALYIKGLDQNKQLVVMKKQGNQSVVVAGALDFLTVQGVEPLSKIIHDYGQIDLISFEKLSSMIQGGFWGKVTDEDGMALYNLLVQNKELILNNRKILNIYHGLCRYLRKHRSPLFFYVKSPLIHDFIYPDNQPPQVFLNAIGFSKLHAKREMKSLGKVEYEKRMKETQDLVKFLHDMKREVPYLFEQYRSIYSHLLLALHQLEPDNPEWKAEDISTRPFNEEDLMSVDSKEGPVL